MAEDRSISVTSRLWRKRPFKYGWVGIIRWIVNAECREPFCRSHRLCWRWHIEVEECPTCGSRITENDMDRMRQLMRNLWKPGVQGNFNPTPPLVLTYDWRTGQVSNG